jgi:hypothetical protein
VDIRVEAMPSRLTVVSAQCDWGLSDSCRLRLRLRNETGADWQSITANGGCTCLEVRIDELAKAGVASGESAIANIVYSKPKEPGMSPKTIRFTIDGTLVSLPILVEWHAPVALHKLEQVNRNIWRAYGNVRRGWELSKVESLNDDVKMLSLTKTADGFAVELESEVKIARTCWLRCDLASMQKGKSTEQSLSVSLESSEPRSVPSRLICNVDKEGMMTGETRILFPRARLGARPNLSRATLLPANGNSLPLTVSEKGLGRIAAKVDFASKSKVPTKALADSSIIRFMFDDDSHLDCPFLVSQE